MNPAPQLVGRDFAVFRRACNVHRFPEFYLKSLFGYICVDAAKQAVAKRDCVKSSKLYWQTVGLAGDHLADEAVLDEYRQALAMIHSL